MTSLVEAVRRNAQHPLFFPLAANACLLAALAAGVYSVNRRLAIIAEGRASSARVDKVSDDGLLPSLASEENPEAVLHTLAEGKEKIAAVQKQDAQGNDSPEFPQNLAAALAEIDQWAVRHEDIDAFQEYKGVVAGELRSAIEAAVGRLHLASLQGNDSTSAQESYGEAGQLIALFPLSDTLDVLKQASELSTAHSVAAARLEAIRRQRYNLWAIGKIGSLLEWLERKASSWTTKDNYQVVIRVSIDLQEIDPVLLEPAAMQLYTLAISKASEAISTTQQSDLAMRLTDPSHAKRRNLGDF